MLKTYYRLTKPGIVYGNAITAIGGFLLAAKGHVHLLVFVCMLAGLSLVVASACVFNNYIDQGIDQKMERTRKRALVKGVISGRAALVYGSVLGALGAVVLFVGTNLLALLCALIGFFFYVVVYGYYKRRSVYGTLVGSISGAVPPVVGYAAATGRLDMGALIVFMILVCWQMPHFYAIAIYRAKDYAAAGIPVWPVEKGVQNTKLQIVLYTAAFVVATLLLTIFGYAGYVYLAVMGAIGLAWLWVGMQGFKVTDDNRWARKMFLFSLIVTLALSGMLSVGALLP